MSRRAQVLLGAGLAFMVGQGFARFGLTLILPEMQIALGMSYADIGLVAGAAFGAYLVCALPAGFAATRWGPRRVISISLVLSAIGLALTGLSSNVGSAIAAQMLNGAAGAGIIIPVLGLSPGWFVQRHWARATGAIVGGGGLGLALSGWLVPSVLQAGGPDGWRLAWLSLALGLMLVAVLAAALLRDPPRSAQALRASPRAVYRSTAIWRIGLAFLCYGAAFAIYGTFFGAQLVGQRGVDNATAGRLWAASGLASVASGMLGGWLSDRFGRRRPLAFLFIAEGLSLAVLAFGEDEGWYLASAILYGLTLWGFPAVLTAASADVVGPDLAPAAVGFTVLCFGVGQALGPLLGGFLAEASGTFGTALLVGVAADLQGFLVTLAIGGRVARTSTFKAGTTPCT